MVKIMTEIDILKLNVLELEKQLHSAYIRIEELNIKLYSLQQQLQTEDRNQHIALGKQ